jgi:2-polyprenyl-3-methyl-5-hydroxy-6-metoxy-1,4-benzoquinol methylase
MDEVALAKEKWVNSADSWIEAVRNRDRNRTHLLDPVMLDCVGDVNGLKVIDIGCGEGRFCRMLSGLGATVTGVDITQALLAEAVRMDPRGNYIECGAENIPLSDNHFDLAISYVVLVDIPDYAKAIVEMARVLKPGGRLVAANVNSFISTSETSWYKDADGRKLHFPVDRYFEERPLHLSWDGISIINWHRPLQSYMSAYLNAGLVLKRFVEPTPTKEAVAEFPQMHDETRIALFNIMVWEKPKVA